MANKDYNFQYTPLTGKLPGNSFVKQTEQAINELAGIVNEGSAQVEVITNLANQANDNSEVALEKANEALETAGRVYITLPNLDDADNYFDSELYYFANSYSANLPVQDTGFLEVKTNDTKTAAEQVFIADTTGLCYFRHGDITSSEVGGETVYSVVWETWSSALASEDYVQGELTNYLPLNGGTVTGSLTVDNNLSVGGTVTGDLVDVKSGSDTAVNTLQRETAYNVDDIVYTSALNAKYYLLCVTAGTTASTLPSFSGATSNAQITDGTVVWRVQTVTSQEKAAQYTDTEVSNAVSAINTRLGTILAANGTATTVGTIATLCSITTHPAGVWLITSFMDLSYSGSGIYSNSIQTANHSGISTRNTSSGGGGNCAVLLTALDENETVNLNGLQTQAGIMRGKLMMVRLA